MARRLLVLVAVIGLVLMLAATALGASVTVRVEGKTQPIFGSVPVKVQATSALAGERVDVTRKEFDLLAELMAEVGKWMQKEDLRPRLADRFIFKAAPLVVLLVNVVFAST